MIFNIRPTTTNTWQRGRSISFSILQAQFSVCHRETWLNCECSSKGNCLITVGSHAFFEYFSFTSRWRLIFRVHIRHLPLYWTWNRPNGMSIINFDLFRFSWKIYWCDILNLKEWFVFLLLWWAKYLVSLLTELFK